MMSPASSSLPLVAVLFAWATAAAVTPNPPRPHVLLLVVDDWGWGNVGFHRGPSASDPGAHEWLTPNIDRLAADGILLDRHYVHAFCSPTRSALQTGRLPVHVQLTLANPCNHANGIPKNMTSIAAKLNGAGYDSHFVGKWDAGMRTPTHTPHGRGYKTGLSYFSHGNWMWTQAEWLGSYSGETNHSPVPACTPDSIPGWNANPRGCAKDLWDTAAPAAHLNGTNNEEYLFTDRIQEVLREHDGARPLFLVYAPKLVHYPLQAPAEYQRRFADIDVPHRRMYAAMTAFLDDQIGNVTEMFRARGLWNDTLMIVTSDNGGYSDAILPCSSNSSHGEFCEQGQAGASNWPLRGSKGNFFEGGIRANAFVSGGFVPAGRRGTREQGLVHVADWYATLCGLAGVPVADEVAARAVPPMPPVDSVDLWPLLSGKVDVSPRDEVLLQANALLSTRVQGAVKARADAASPARLWKLLTGRQGGATWPGPVYPNASSVAVSSVAVDCGSGCLFDLTSDPHELNDVASSEPTVLSAMVARLKQQQSSIWRRPVNMSASDPACMKTAFEHYGGFLGPYMELAN